MRNCEPREDIHALIAQRRTALDEPERRRLVWRRALWGLLVVLSLAGAGALVALAWFASEV